MTGQIIAGLLLAVLGGFLIVRRIRNYRRDPKDALVNDIGNAWAFGWEAMIAEFAIAALGVGLIFHALS